MTNSEIGHAIVAAFDAGNDPPDFPLVRCDLAPDEWLSVYRRGKGEDTGRAVVLRGRRGLRLGKAFETTFSWPVMREDPAGTVEAILADAHRDFDAG